MKDYLNKEKEHNRLKKRGLKKSKLSLEDVVLLTFYYLRHYPTFNNLSNIFDISESYCYKIYYKTVRILAKVGTLPNRKSLLENPPETLIIGNYSVPLDKREKNYFNRRR